MQLPIGVNTELGSDDAGCSLISTAKWAYTFNSSTFPQLEWSVVVPKPFNIKNWYEIVFREIGR